MLTEHIHLLAPPSGRRDTLVAALELLHAMAIPHPFIVEIGTSRDPTPAGCLADGWGTRMFAWYASQVEGSVVSIDPAWKACRSARQVVADLATWVTIRQEYAEKVLPTLKERIDLLYMDGPHGADYSFSARIHLEFYRALNAPPRLVLFDDIKTPDYGVKGTLAIPAMIADGYELLWVRGVQALLRWPE
jgi:hypothetical protein